MKLDKLDIGDLAREAKKFEAELSATKLQLAPADRWYPYNSMANVFHLDGLLTRGNRDIYELSGGKPIADIGSADGDLAFFLASKGLEVDIIDWGPTNFNSLEGARLLAKHFSFGVTITEVNLDSQFSLPRNDYGLVIFLGILYHLQNPFFVLQQLSRSSDYLLLSTRIAAVTPNQDVDLRSSPLAYLVDPDELNGDPTNYWIFSITGLQRLCSRTGWEIRAQITLGCTDGTSDPASSSRDERAFLLLKSRNQTKSLRGCAS